MEILHILQCTNLGGMEHTVLMRMTELKRRGYAPRLVSLNRVGLLGPELCEAGIPHVGLNYRSPWGLPTIPEMLSAFRRPKPDRIMMSGHNLAAMTALAGLSVRDPVLTMHFHHQGVKSRFSWRLVYSTAMKLFRAITFPSSFVRNEALEIYPALEPVSRVVPTPFRLKPMTTPEQRSAARARLGLSDSSFVAGNAGWLIPRKRWDVFLSVAAVVAQRLPNASFLIAGDGPSRGELEAQAARLGLSDRIVWLGWSHDMDTVYSALDVLLFNSDWDALGRTPVEAITLGVPVVASLVHGGLAEFIRPGIDAFIFDHHDIGQLADHVISLTDPELGRRMVASARDRLAQNFSPEQDGDRICQLLELP